LSLGLFAGLEKMYRVGDIGQFLDAVEGRLDYHFSKNFIYEPARMYFEKADRIFLEFLYNLRDTRQDDFTGNTAFINGQETDRLLDFTWQDIRQISFHKQSDHVAFVDDIDLKVSLSEEEGSLLLLIDYSEHGDFLTIDKSFTYLMFKEKGLIAKLSESKRELIMNLYPFRNNENKVAFRISPAEKRFFVKNFLDRFGDALGITMDKDVQKAISESSLLSKVYFDVAPRGIVSKVEFCYGDKVINPLDGMEADRSFRELAGEKKVVDELKVFGFRENGRLFLLDDIEKIMTLLTDYLKGLKKEAQVYYSEDFKKLYVKNLSSVDMGMGLSEDGSVIHMNINLEGITDEELLELLNAISSKKKYYRLRSGPIINLSNVESSKLINLLNSLEIDKSSLKDGLFEIPLNRCMYIDRYMKENGIDNVSVDSRLGCIMKNMAIPEEIEVTLDKGLDGILRNYQATGVKWLKTMAGYSFGGILADDMGLGKTLQSLVFIASEKNRELPCLVVAPTSVVYNWQREAEKFVPGLKVLMITGSKDRRTMLINTCANSDLVITSYGALRNDVEDYKKVKFSYVFVDEAQNIKNPMTLNANSVKSLKAGCCFALTGTPIENRLTELWSIFDFIMPGYLYSRSKFASSYEEPIVRERNADKLNELSAMIRPFMIRRLKKDVLGELPDKIESNFICPMTEEQKKLYAAYYKDFKNELLPRLDEYGIEGIQMEILAALTRLRQICAHPGTFLEDYDGGSGKLEAAKEIITESIDSGHSVLLFSQFTRILKIIRDELESKGVNHYYLDGTMNTEERLMEIDNFNSDREAVFLISLKAGGTGLNLTKADVVIHFDPWWNPAVENQASDRAHRIGQKNSVQVYRLLTEGTIEEKIGRLQERKRDLAESIIRPGESFFKGLRAEEIRELF